MQLRKNWDSVVRTATGYGLEDQGVGFWVPVGARIFIHFSMSSRMALEPTQTPIQWSLGALSPGVKRPGREADHSPIRHHGIVLNWLNAGTTLPFFIAAKKGNLKAHTEHFTNLISFCHIMLHADMD
jgi:hypothetical protein